MKRLWVIAAAAAISGCGTTPSRIALPLALPNNPGSTQSGTTANSDVIAEGRYKIGDAADARTVATAQGRVLPMERTHSGVLAQLRAHQIVWQQESENLADSVDRFGNTTFAGALIGGAGALASSIDVGRAGAGLAGGSGLWANHYALQTQAENYRLAADAVQCMYMAVVSLPPDFWSATFDDHGVPRLPRTFYTEHAPANKSEDAGAGYDKLSTMFRRIHTAVLSVREKLATKQRSVTLATPRPEDIASALRDQQTAGSKGNQTANAMMAARTESKRLLATEEEAAAVQSERLSQEQKKDEQTARTSRFALASRDRTALLSNKKALVASAAGMTEQQVEEVVAKSAVVREQTLSEAFQLPEALDTCGRKIGG